jgi:hypothetical protein
MHATGDAVEEVTERAAIGRFLLRDADPERLLDV